VPEVLAPAVAALAHAARQQAPYQLLTHALGHDPLTGRPAPAAPLALARTLVGLLPDGEARFQQLQAAGPALAQLPAWLHHQLAAHQLAGPRLARLLAQTAAELRALDWRDLLAPLAAAERLALPWLALGQDVARFVGRTEGALLRWLVAAVLGPDHAAHVLRALDQGGDLLLRILRHPLPFLTNLVAAGKRGFNAFLANGPRHLRAAVQDWLLGGLANAGLHLPARLDVAGLLDLLLQVFDLTKAAVLHRLRLRLPNLPTERLQQVLTQVGGVALTLWQHGPQAAWQAISAHAEGLRAQALDFVQQQVLGVAAKAVPLFLASLAVPGGAFVQLARGLYNGVMLFVEKGRQIAQVGQALFASASAIAAGQLAPATQAVENTLVKMLPVALNFLGRLLRLDAIPQAIQTGLQKVRVPVEKALNRVLDTVAQKANALWNSLQTGASKTVAKSKEIATAVGTTAKGWLDFREEFTLPDKETHAVFLGAQGQLMLASSPAPYLEFLRKHDTMKLLPAEVPLRADAHKHAANIDRLAQDRATLEQNQMRYLQQEKKPSAQPSAGVLVDQTAALAKNAAALDRQLLGLAQVTMHLMAQSHSSLLPPRANQPIWSTPLSPQKYGTGMLMEYFTTGPVKPGSTRILTTGKKPTEEINDSFGAINLRRNAAGSYYIKGHLLSQQLHGPGKWENLTPLSRSGNDKHEDEVERVLKTASANYDAASYNPADPRTFPRAYYYSVVPQYGRPLRQDLLDQLVPGSADDPLRRLITAEQHVPRNLVCVLWEVDAQTGARKRQVVARTVDNPVEQAGLFDYQLGRKPVMIKISQMPSEISLAAIMGQTLSYAIWDVTLQLNGRAISQADLLKALSTHRNGQTGALTLTPGELAALQKTFSLLVQRKLITFG
jgi:hypothetical protein